MQGGDRTGLKKICHGCASFPEETRPTAGPLDPTSRRVARPSARPPGSRDPGPLLRPPFRTRQDGYTLLGHGVQPAVRDRETDAPPKSLARGNTAPGMRLIVAHHHFRPGGVRRVIELALPPMARLLGARLKTILLAAGESPDPGWYEDLQAAVRHESGRGLPTPEWGLAIEPALGYLAELAPAPASTIREAARRHLEALLQGLGPGQALVWVHNPGLGRNLPATQEWARACARRKIPLVWHHHDWWFDNRWHRWPELHRSGGRTPSAVARALIPDKPTIRHVAINRADAGPLRRWFPGRAAWIPNPAGPEPRPPQARVLAARRWLAARTGHRSPFWILPCRLLRRKNIAEALLLLRWLQPGARLVTTGGASSLEELPYAEALARETRRHRWPLDLSVLHQASGPAPTVADLLAVADTVVLTSLIEGFGLPFLEAATAKRPLVARRLRNVAPDLGRLGFRFPNLYREVRVPQTLFDVEAERRRQEERFGAWRARLPREVLPWVNPPPLLGLPSRNPVAFSRLTFTAQAQVLANSPDHTLRESLPANAWLARWLGKPRPSVSWPDGAGRRLTGRNYARHLLRLAATNLAPPPRPGSSHHAQTELLRDRLGAAHIYPLLWDPAP